MSNEYAKYLLEAAKKIKRDENGLEHCLDGPAMITHAGTKLWYKHGRRHCASGPAIIYENDIKVWYLDGARIRSNYEYQKKAKLTDEEMLVIVIKYGSVDSYIFESL